ncbi:hypothetical protein EVAR_9327_1 [Eumeta japonica]|uniref:Uncharacterized protein n=1 Tax=Eumeta variegata TaxID=151549 RepID=A0A4C1TM08_EUMVA|nr:hypothetical protein EVAR_9327_1 [Eumeta japonica]
MSSVRDHLPSNKAVPVKLPVRRDVRGPASATNINTFIIRHYDVKRVIVGENCILILFSSSAAQRPIIVIIDVKIQVGILFYALSFPARRKFIEIGPFIEPLELFRGISRWKNGTKLACADESNRAPLSALRGYIVSVRGEASASAASPLHPSCGRRSSAIHAAGVRTSDSSYHDDTMAVHISSPDSSIRDVMRNRSTKYRRASTIAHVHSGWCRRAGAWHDEVEIARGDRDQAANAADRRPSNVCGSLTAAVKAARVSDRLHTDLTVHAADRRQSDNPCIQQQQSRQLTNGASATLGGGGGAGLESGASARNKLIFDVAARDVVTSSSCRSPVARRTEKQQGP